jgi:hypothetical protein
MPFPIEDQSCSTWALSGDESRATSIHEAYTQLTDSFLKLTEEERRKKLGKNLQEQRLETMRQTAALRDPTEYKVDQIYFCGCFMTENDLIPCHYWIEDHTHGITTDTFINRDSVVVVNRVGAAGQPFQSGCEGSPFPADQIVRVPIDGYTKGQVDILTHYTRPKTVVDSVLQAKRDEIRSLTRMRDDNQYMLDHLNKYPHRNNPKGIRQLRDDVNKYTTKVQEHEAELQQLKGALPLKPALPQLDKGRRIDITQGDSLLKRAMNGAILARQTQSEEMKEKGKELEARAPESGAQQQSSYLLSSLNSSLGNFFTNVSSVVTKTDQYDNQNQLK